MCRFDKDLQIERYKYLQIIVKVELFDEKCSEGNSMPVVWEIDFN